MIENANPNEQNNTQASGLNSHTQYITAEMKRYTKCRLLLTINKMSLLTIHKLSLTFHDTQNVACFFFSGYTKCRLLLTTLNIKAQLCVYAWIQLVLKNGSVGGGLKY